MKVLLVHNYYGSEAPSGENAAYEAERELLRAHGHEVVEHTVSSDRIRSLGLIGEVLGGLSTPYNSVAAGRVRRLVVRIRPDVVHVHNFFPLLSPAVLRAAHRDGAPTVLTLHNYRLFCAAAIPVRNGAPCSLCLDRRSAWPALRYGCYRRSRAATLPLAAMITLHSRLGTWVRDVDRFIALTEFQRKQVVAAGLAPDKVVVRSNFYLDPPAPLPWDAREDVVVFLGRLSAEKGVGTLIRAWHLWGEAAPKLEIVGSGPEQAALEGLAASGAAGRRVSFAGQVPFGLAQDRLARARILVLPSLCYEGFPMVIREAYALAVPVAASALGALPELVEDGVTGALHQPGDAQALLAVVRRLWADRRGLERMASGARAAFERRYTADTAYDRLMTIYREAMSARVDRGAQR